MTSYVMQRGTRAGVMLWRAVSSGSEHHVAPDGVMDLMWFRGRLMVAGADTRSMTVATRPGEATWGLQLAPGVATELLGVAAHELTDQRVELSDLVTVADGAGPASDSDVPAALERVFIALWARADPDPSTLRLAGSLDRAAREGLPVTETAVRHHLSERSLRRVSNTLFGYGPKTLMRIHRFQRALHLAMSAVPLSVAATAAGYVDQSHFTRETRRLTGRTPAEITRAPRPRG